MSDDANERRLSEQMVSPSYQGGARYPTMTTEELVREHYRLRDLISTERRSLERLERFQSEVYKEAALRPTEEMNAAILKINEERKG